MMMIIHLLLVTSASWILMYCSGDAPTDSTGPETESPQLSSSNENTAPLTGTGAGAEISTVAPAAAVTPCRNGSIPYCGELNTPGPHCMECLRALWEEIGCTPEGEMSPDRAPPHVGFWNGKTVQLVRVHMEEYRNIPIACSGPDKPDLPETTKKDPNVTSIVGTAPVDSHVPSAALSATGIVTSSESKLVPPNLTGPVLTGSPVQAGTVGSGMGSQSHQTDQQATTAAPPDITAAEKAGGPSDVTSADSSHTTRAPSAGEGQLPSGESSDSVTSSSSGARTESKPLAVSAKVEEEGNRTTGQAHTGTTATAEAVSTSTSKQKGIPRVLLYAVLAVIALVLIMISVAVYCEFTRKRKRENKNDRQPQASLQNASDETGAEAGSQTELHTSGSFRGKHRESIPIKDLSPIKAENTETPKDNIV